MSDELLKVLIVDDEHIIRQGIVHFLDWEDNGYTIVGEASNGQEALSFLKQHDVDIMFCDIMMPVMDGIELSHILKTEYPHIKFIVLSSYGDFDNVKQMFLNGASDYILKPTLNPTMLLTALKKVQDKLDSTTPSPKEMSLSKYIIQYIMGFDAKTIDDPFLDKQGYQIIAIQHQGLGDKNQLDYFYGSQALQKLTAGQVCVCAIQNTMDAVVIATNQDLSADLETILPETLHDCVFAASPVFSNFKEIRKAYHEQVLPLFPSRFYTQAGSVLTKDHEIHFQNLQRFEMSVFTSLLARLQMLDAIHMLETFVNAQLQHKVNPQELKPFVGNMLYSVISTMEEHEIRSNYILDFKLTTVSTLDSCVDEPSYRKQLSRVTSDLREVVKNYHIDKNEEVMNQIVKYMHLNYYKPLSLQQLAKEFNFSYSYLSSYFNERSDLNFNEYLNQIRINKAAELLRSGIATISDVGYEVGFSDHSYFCKVFKKQMGVTPSAYRRGGPIRDETA